MPSHKSQIFKAILSTPFCNHEVFLKPYYFLVFKWPVRIMTKDRKKHQFPWLSDSKCLGKIQKIQDFVSQICTYVDAILYMLGLFFSEIKGFSVPQNLFLMPTTFSRTADYDAHLTDLMLPFFFMYQWKVTL